MAYPPMKWKRLQYLVIRSILIEFNGTTSMKHKSKLAILTTTTYAQCSNYMKLYENFLRLLLLMHFREYFNDFKLN